LTVILGHCELAETQLDPVRCRDHATKARRAAQACVELVKSIFAAAKNTPTAYDVNVVVRELAENIEGANLLPAAIKLTVDLDTAGDVRVAGDSMGILRVLLNLCLNARDAMEGRGPGELAIVTRGAQTESESVTIQVRDTGRGMSADQLNSLWLPHVSEDLRHGYGLTIVKQTLDAAQGMIAVESAPGKGTTFTIKLKTAGPRFA
jgi:signal transduction histidine kinase